MKPVEQRVLHNPDSGQFGDCFRAALASLLEDDSVPHFAEHDYPLDWPKPLIEYLAQRGLALIEFEFATREDMIRWFEPLHSAGYNIHHLLSGQSPRFKDTTHAVVALNGYIVHDPHPDKTGLDGGPYQVGLRVKI